MFKIQPRVEQDRFGNDVSLIEVEAHGHIHKFRMVHHTPRGSWRQTATIYAGRGVYVKYKTCTYDNPCRPSVLECAGYSQHWGDGESMGAFSNPAGPNLNRKLDALHDDYEKALCLILSEIAGNDDVWLRKEIKPKNVMH